MYDYMIQNGSEINYVQGNGYMPRMMHLVLNDKAKFIGKIHLVAVHTIFMRM